MQTASLADIEVIQKSSNHSDNVFFTLKQYAPPGYVICIACLTTVSTLNNIRVNWGRCYSCELYNLCISANLNERELLTQIQTKIFYSHKCVARNVWTVIASNADDWRCEFDINALNFIQKQPKMKLEIVDQWSTRITPPHRRGWQWAIGGLQLNIVQNHKAATSKAT